MTAADMTARAGDGGGGLAYFDDREPAPADFLAAVMSGFSTPQKTLPAKFFYDERGSEIFNRICETSEYYVTRTEVALLGEIGAEISRLAGPGVCIIEYGCGSNLKIRALLDALAAPAEYVAIDISRRHLQAAAAEIAADYPGVRVGAICADFTGPLEIPDGAGRPRLGFFPGSTIGNQTPAESVAFLTRIRRQIGNDGALLIGVDLKKDKATLDAAYNDAAGHTAAFNLNLFARMKSELGAEVDLDAFSHLAFYNQAEGRIEMHIRSERAQTITVGGRDFAFALGETVHTENSYKYTLAEFSALAARAGFRAKRNWTDAAGMFSIHYLSVV